MGNKLRRLLAAFATFVLTQNSALAASFVVFDFDDIHSGSKKGPKAADIESYMEGLFGSDLTVSENTTAGGSRPVRNLRMIGLPSESVNVSNSFLKVSRGKGASGITLDFKNDPIDSFSVDFHLLKRAKSFTILADGVVINQQSLTKSQRKTGLTGHQENYFFAAPVQKLQFVGLKKKSFTIDNLVINIPLESTEDTDLDESSLTLTTLASEGNSDLANSLGGAANTSALTVDQISIAAIPEPSSWSLLGYGSMCLLGVLRRMRPELVN